MMTREALDLVVRDARLRQDAGEHWIGIHAGRITRITRDPLAAPTIVDAGGCLVVPSFVDPHLHACKAYTLTAVGDQVARRYSAPGMSEAAGAIRAAAVVKDRYERSWNARNARRALTAGLAHGVTHVLAFADTDTRARMEGVRGVMDARDELGDVMTVRVVAFPQDGVVCDPGAEELVRQALEEGADVVGGIPWIEADEHAQQEHIERMLDLAVRFDRDVAMLVDDAGDPTLRTTEMLARAAVARGWEGRVTACHARALGVYSEEDFRALLPLLRDAGLRFVTDPHTGALFLRVFDLLETGVPVALGQDDVADAYYPFGQHNALEVAFLAAHMWRRFGFDDMELLLDLVTSRAAEVFGLVDHAVAVGAPANLAVLAAPTVHEALRTHAPPKAVVSRGRLVAETTTATTLTTAPS